MAVKTLIFRNPNDSSQDDMNKLWISFSSWYEQSVVVYEYFKGEYTE